MAFWNKKKKEEPVAEQQAESKAESKSGGGLFSSWKSVLKKTSTLLNTDIRDLWKNQGELVDEDFLQRLFAILVRSDMGGDMARQIRDRIGTDFRARKVEFQEVLDIISQEIRQTLEQGGTEIAIAESGPTVILVVGVNGSGKTTSIAKLAHRYTSSGKRVLLGAGDTFAQPPLNN